MMIEALFKTNCLEEYHNWIVVFFNESLRSAYSLQIRIKWTFKKRIWLNTLCL